MEQQDPNIFKFYNAPGIPQHLTTDKYIELLHYFTNDENGVISFYNKEEIQFELRDTKCNRCDVYHKKSSLNKDGICAKTKCNPIGFGHIPRCITILRPSEKDALRLIRIFAIKQKSNSYLYERFKGTTNLSVNWKVWKTCAGLISTDPRYSLMPKIFNRKVKEAFRWLLKIMCFMKI